ncbi:hypothetical protein BDZ89DRAFT_958355 [Hymenopellis radicata]|nr:hypothetical protein BDZ89DRAFT_958355 [Hymenopellis radicata]
MVAFNNVLSSVLLVIVYASSSIAAPWPTDSKHTTHRVRHISRQLKLNTYHPRSTFKSFGTGVDHPLSKRADATLGEMTTTFLATQLGVDVQKVAYRAGFAGEMASHAYLRQSHDGIPFANAVANVAMQNNKVVSYGSSFVTCSSIAPSTPSVAVEDAISMAENMLGGTFNQWNSTLEYLVKEDNTAALTHVVQIQNQDTGAWFEAFVDAHSGELLSVTDFVAKASYLVVPFEDETLDEGGQVLLQDPENLKASPQGWHSDGQNDFTGNNAFAFKGRQLSAQSAAGLTFNFPVDLTTEPNVGANVDAARTNAFFIVNSVHDVTYLYGFTEAAFNFQSNNFGNGGRGNDPVSISVQDAAGVDNADFSTPGDGQSGQMRMFLWDFTKPGRDGALENDVIVHENTHGVTNRMTGGGTGRCLQTLEAGGMGEGWSDAMADWVANSATIEDFAVGAFVFDNPAGLRSFLYSTDAAVNPLRYSSLQKLNEVHDIGEVWANIMHNVLSALVADLGFSQTAKTDPTGTEGNVVFLHLMLDALQLQPCNPDFISARDAWYQADKIRFNGANTCTLQVAFASRGLGLNAKNHVDDATVSRACR